MAETFRGRPRRSARGRFYPPAPTESQKTLTTAEKVRAALGHHKPSAEKPEVDNSIAEKPVETLLDRVNRALQQKKQQPPATEKVQTNGMQPILAIDNTEALPLPPAPPVTFSLGLSSTATSIPSVIISSVVTPTRAAEQPSSNIDQVPPVPPVVPPPDKYFDPFDHPTAKEYPIIKYPDLRKETDMDATQILPTAASLIDYRKRERDALADTATATELFNVTYKAPDELKIEALAARIQTRFLNPDGSFKLGISSDMLQRFVKQEEIAEKDLTAALSFINSQAKAAVDSAPTGIQDLTVATIKPDADRAPAQPRTQDTAAPADPPSPGESPRGVSIEAIALKIQARFLNSDGAFRRDISPLDLENFVAQEGLGGTDLSAALSYLNSQRKTAPDAPIPAPAKDPEPSPSAVRGAPTSTRRGLPIILEPGHPITVHAPDVSPVPPAPATPPAGAAVSPSPAPQARRQTVTPTPPVTRRSPQKEAAATAFPSSGRTAPRRVRRDEIAPETFPAGGRPDYSAPRRQPAADTSPRIPVLQPGLDSEGQKEQAMKAAEAYEERRKLSIAARLKTELPKTAITAILAYLTKPPKAEGEIEPTHSPNGFRINAQEALQGLTGKDFQLILSGIKPEDVADFAQGMLLDAFSQAWDRAVLNKPISDREAETIRQLHHLAVSGIPKESVMLLLKNHLTKKPTNLSKIRAPRTNNEIPGVDELSNL